MAKELCWQITEEFPVEVEVKVSWTGKYYCIIVPPMKITYATFQRLGDNLTEEAMAYGENMDGRIYDTKIRSHPSDVSQSCYSYCDGACSFHAGRETDVLNWLVIYNQIVICKEIPKL